MVIWDIGALFFLCWLIIFFPISILGLAWFWIRRDTQPIKARSPLLVLITSGVLTIWVVLVAVQRIIGDAWPCELTLYGSYFGVISLSILYIWRCWLLYFTFNLTQQRLAYRRAKVSGELNNYHTWFIAHRYLISTPNLCKLFGSLFVILIMPCTVISAANEDIHDIRFRGDNCDKAQGRAEGDKILLGYLASFGLLFVWFAVNLRSVIDAFLIKQELRRTCLIVVPAVIMWGLFNTVEKLDEVNNTKFPFSTLAFTLGGSALVVISTHVPLYHSLFQPLLTVDKAAGDLGTLRGVLVNEEGRKAFEDFLNSEFSVENFMFWTAVDNLRTKQFAALHSTFDPLPECKRIMEEFVVESAPYQVNLPADVRNTLMAAMRLESQLGPQKPEEDADDDTLTATVFDECQHEVFRLMERDSFPRFTRSDYYLNFMKRHQDEQVRQGLLKEVGVL